MLDFTRLLYSNEILLALMAAQQEHHPKVKSRLKGGLLRGGLGYEAGWRWRWQTERRLMKERGKMNASCWFALREKIDHGLIALHFTLLDKLITLYKVSVFEWAEQMNEYLTKYKHTSFFFSVQTQKPVGGRERKQLTICISLDL